MDDSKSHILMLCEQQVKGGDTFQSRGNLGRKGKRSERGGARAHPIESQYGEGSSSVMKEGEIQVWHFHLTLICRLCVSNL